jgi:Helix-turn-helix
MRAFHDAVENDIEIHPVVVVTRSFPARPSAVPDIRDFVRQQLAQSPLSGDSIRALGERVADVLLEAAGAGGTIQVSLRIFTNYAEVDVLRTTQAEAIGDTGAVSIPAPSERASKKPELGPAPTRRAGTVTTSNGKAAAATGPGPAARATHPPGITFAEWLAESLRREGMTMEAAARQLKVSVKTVSRWVRGATEPRLCDLSRIREIFGDLPFP